MSDLVDMPLFSGVLNDSQMEIWRGSRFSGPTESSENRSAYLRKHALLGSGWLTSLPVRVRLGASPGSRAPFPSFLSSLSGLVCVVEVS